jgi:DNA-directed RNA polymerase II subunit RPB4
MNSRRGVFAVADPGLVCYPLCATGSLCPETAEEAKRLIPSLKDKFNDLDLDDLLEEMGKLQG